MPRPCRLLPALALLLLLAPSASPQSDADPRDAMRRWLQEQRRDFREYVDARDREFAAFLSQAWREFEVLAGRRGDPVPKPPAIPRTGDAVPAPAPPDTVATPPVRPAPFSPRPTPPAPAPPAGADGLDLEYLGLVYRLPLPRQMAALPARTPGPEDAAAAWLALSAVDSGEFLAAAARLASDRQLGDWGLLQLLGLAAARAYPDDPSRQALLHWYLGARAGLDLRLAHGRPGYVVLYAAEGVVFQVDFLARDGRAYYLHDPAGRFTDATRLRSYDGQAPGRRHALRLGLAALPRTAPDPVERRLRWLRADGEQTVVVELDRNLIAFLASLPQTGLQSHFGAALSPAVLTALERQLGPRLADRPAAQQVAVLLHFVQHAVPYATDQEQFGREDYLYPDETLFHPAADCEDRAALFAALVRELVGRAVIGLDYPGHIATAVAWDPPAPGDHLELDGVLYTVCDPTYVGADPGRSMPLPGSPSPGLIVAGR